MDPPALLADADVPVAARATQVEPAPPADGVVRDQGRVRGHTPLGVARRLHGDAAEVGGRVSRSRGGHQTEADHGHGREGDLDASHHYPFIDEPSYYYACN